MRKEHWGTSGPTSRPTSSRSFSLGYIFLVAKFTRYFEAGGMEGWTQIDVRAHTILIAYFQTYMYYVQSEYIGNKLCLY